MSRGYAVHEVFASLQGEGLHTGRPALFVRFAGCNLWSGREQDRARDAERHEAACPAWCDTTFRGPPGRHGGQLSLAALLRACEQEADGVAFVVLTGGEPLLQADAELIGALRRRLALPVHVETNGTLPLPPGANPDWIALSPKTPPDRLALRVCDELKVVYPSPVPPVAYAQALRVLARDALLVQPRAGPDLPAAVGACILYVREHPGWRLGVQAHKVLGLP
jgi:organic radical activating enzyme